MAHTENIKAFMACKQVGIPLISAYTLLVATELSLKDQIMPWKSGHNVPEMLDSMTDPGLISLSTQLRTALAKIKHTDKTGSISPVDPAKYPFVRYAIHAKDDPAGSPDSDFSAIVTIVEDIHTQLRTKGYAL